MIVWQTGMSRLDPLFFPLIWVAFRSCYGFTQQGLDMMLDWSYFQTVQAFQELNKFPFAAPTVSLPGSWFIASGPPGLF